MKLWPALWMFADVGRLLSVDQTCRLQRRSLYAYLADALTAKARGDPVPSLMGA